MKRNPVIAILFLAVLLIGGMLIFRTLNSDQARSATQGGFQAWFWEQRGLDLVVQIVLVFTGALGIAAILPVEEDHDGP